jgi:hypothetical protein
MEGAFDNLHRRRIALRVGKFAPTRKLLWWRAVDDGCRAPTTVAFVLRRGKRCRFSPCPLVGVSASRRLIATPGRPTFPFVRLFFSAQHRQSIVGRNAVPVYVSGRLADTPCPLRCARLLHYHPNHTAHMIPPRVSLHFSQTGKVAKFLTGHT